MSTRLEEQRCGCMPQIVEADAWETSRGRKRVVDAGDEVASVDRRPNLGGEYQITILPSFPSPNPLLCLTATLMSECAVSRGAESHGLVRACGLGFRELQRARHPLKRAADLDGAALPVDVGPAELKQFAFARPAREGDCIQRP